MGMDGAPTAGLDAAWDAGAEVDAQLAQILGATSGPLNWRDLPATDAAAAWAQLRAWVDWFRFEFGYDHRVVPPCWYRHPALVNLLAALRDHWTHAYDRLASAAAASEWHRALLVLEPRLRDWASRSGCTIGAHRPDVIADYPDDTAEWTQHVRADVAARRARETTPTPLREVTDA